MGIIMSLLQGGKKRSKSRRKVSKKRRPSATDKCKSITVSKDCRKSGCWWDYPTNKCSSVKDDERKKLVEKQREYNKAKGFEPKKRRRRNKSKSKSTTQKPRRRRSKSRSKSKRRSKSRRPRRSRSKSRSKSKRRS